MKKHISLVSVLFVLFVFAAAYASAQELSSALKPVSRPNLEWWMPRHEKNVEEFNKGGINLLMIGDSITHGWERAGKDVWTKYYEPRKAVNLGFGGDRTEHVLWRLDNLPISKINPKAAVLMIGTNNSNTAKETADGIKAVVQKLEKAYPNMKILVLYIFPRDNQPDGEKRKKVNEINSYLPEFLKDEKNVTLLDIGKVFLDENGVLQPEVMKDFVHPGADGYKLWAEAMEPTLAKLLGDEEVKK
ncbi:MAG: GDSL-type esterase/lipase family protein [Planctomycetaceae bacterium]|nr:GDSL-type esterase/lipase family protein [Planctomycetaceae bacterium]